MKALRFYDTVFQVSLHESRDAKGSQVKHSWQDLQQFKASKQNKVNINGRSSY